MFVVCWILSCFQTRKKLIFNTFQPTYFSFQNYDHFVPPCRELCLKAKDGCVESMHGNGIEWPEAFECSQYPSIEDPNVVCLPEPEKHKNEQNYNQQSYEQSQHSFKQFKQNKHNLNQKSDKNSNFDQQNEKYIKNAKFNPNYSLTAQEQEFFKLESSNLKDNQIYEYEEDYNRESDTFLINNPAIEPRQKNSGIVNDDDTCEKVSRVEKSRIWVFFCLLEP